MTDARIGQEVESVLSDVLDAPVPGHDTDLLESGLLDSLGLVDLIVALERRFDLVIDLIDLDLDDVRTTRSLTRVVQLRLDARRPPAGQRDPGA